MKRLRILSTLSVFILGCNTFGDLDTTESTNNPNSNNSISNNSISNNSTNNVSNNGTNNASNNSNNSNNNFVQECVANLVTLEPSTGAVTWPIKALTCPDPRGASLHVPGTPLPENVTDISIGFDIENTLTVVAATVNGLVLREVSVTNEIALSENLSVLTILNPIEFHLAPFVDGNSGGYFAFTAYECANSIESFLTLTNINREQSRILGGSCQGDRPSPVFSIGSAGTLDEPTRTGQYTWLEAFGERYLLNAIPVQNLDPSRVLRVGDEDLTAASTIRSTTGDLVAYSNEQGVFLWQATAGAGLASRCGIDIPKPVEISDTVPSSALAFDLLHLGENFYVFAQADDRGVQLRRLYYDVSSGSIETETIPSPTSQDTVPVSAVRLAAFDSGFIVFHEETGSGQLPQSWLMTPYLTTADNMAWEPSSDPVIHSYPPLDLLGVEMAVIETVCDVTAIIATRFSQSSSDYTNVEGGRFEGIKSAQ